MKDKGFGGGGGRCAGGAEKSVVDYVDGEGEEDEVDGRENGEPNRGGEGGRGPTLGSPLGRVGTVRVPLWLWWGGRWW